MKKSMKKILAFVLAASMLTGCGANTKDVNQSKVEVETETTKSEESVFVDDAKREVTIPTTITKVAVTGPFAQMMVFAIAPDLMVGFATDWDENEQKYLSEDYKNLPVLGQLYGTKGELNPESLLEADPDIVIDMGEPKDTIKEDMDDLQEKFDIPFIHITMHLDNTGESFRKLGTLLNREADAEKLAAYCEEAYDTATELMDKEKENKKSVVYCLGDKGTNVIATGSFQAELLNLMTDNKAVIDNPTSKGTGNEVDLEQIILWNPEVILFAPESVYDTVDKNAAWQELDAIKTGQYYEVPFGPYNWLGFPPSVQRYLGMMWLSELLYPQDSQIDLQKEVTEYYNLFYHCDLTEEDYNQLISRSIGKANE